MYHIILCVSHDPRDMAQLHVTRVKREFREIITSEEVSHMEKGRGIPYVMFGYE